MSFFNTGKDLAGLEQGDVLYPVAFIGFEPRSAVVKVSGQTKVEVNLMQPQEFAEGEILSAFTLSCGMIVSQSCDIRSDGNKPILIARIHECAKELKDFKPAKLQDSVKLLKNPGRSPTLFYVPEFKSAEFSLPHSVVSLLEIESYPPSSIEELTTIRKLRLSRDALQQLQERFAYCFGRFGIPDDLYDS